MLGRVGVIDGKTDVDQWPGQLAQFAGQRDGAGFTLPAVFMATRAAFTVPIDRERGTLPLTGHLQRAQRPAWVRRIVE